LKSRRIPGTSTLATIYEATNTIDTFRSLINSTQPLSEVNKKKIHNIFNSTNSFSLGQLTTRFDEFLTNIIKINIDPVYKPSILSYFSSGKSLSTTITDTDLKKIKDTFIKFLQYKKINDAEIFEIKRILGAFIVNNKKPSPVVVAQKFNENRERAAASGFIFPL
jgi:hypothetical protein